MHLLHFAMRRALPVLGAALVCASAFAQDAYPAKPVKFIVNFPPGGPADLIARTLAGELQKSLKPADLKPVMVITSSGLLVGVESSRSPA